MTTRVLSIVFIAMMITSCNQNKPSIGEMDFPEGQVQHIVRAKDVQWKPCPPNLPDGCEMAVLEGNPKIEDLFTVRFKVSGDFVMPPHTHPKEERATIISGMAYVAFGENTTKADAKGFGPGDYYVNARNEIHSVWADSSTIIQVTGIGPWEAHFVED